MNDVSHLAAPLLIAAMIAFAAPVAAQPAVAIDLDTALTTAMGHPLLCGATHREREAAARVRAEDDVRPWTLGADARALHQRIPTLAVGGVTTPTTDTVALGADVGKTFAWGTRVGLRVETRYQRSAIPVAPGASDQLELGPGYGVTARLSVEQPLLRGAGSDLGEAELRARRQERRASRRRGLAQERVILRDVHLGYYELWYAEEALAIERATLALAEAELGAARARVATGAEPASSINAHLTERAERAEAVEAAELLAQQRGLELAWLVGLDEAAVFSATASPPAPPVMGRRSLKHATRRALAESPALAALDADLHAARERLRLAGENDRPALDLSGWVQSDGLGHQAVGPAFSQLGTFGAVSAQVGLRFEAPVSSSRHDAERSAARAAIDSLVAEQRALRQQIASDVRVLVARAKTSRRRLALARETVEAARADLAAARGRHHAGQAILLEVREAMDALRRAELRRRRLEVDWASADAALRALTGEPLTA
ncbi:MAG: TolC family protein, partial [Myxococcales bacterium]|nr:TolC family protein [Myxococcales bacterium]